MKNLIYLNKENFKQDSFLSKLKYLACEFTLYFDGSNELRQKGFGIADIFYPNIIENEKYETLMKFKKNLIIVLRWLTLISIWAIGIGCYSASNHEYAPLGLFIFIIIGAVLYAFPFNTNVFEKLDKWEEFLNQYILTIPLKEKEEDKNLELKIAKLKMKGNHFSKVPIEKVLAFFEPFREGSNASDQLKPIQMKDSDYLKFITQRFVINSDELLNIKLIKGKKKDIRTLFHEFYHYSTSYYEDSKMYKSIQYAKLYSLSFQGFNPNSSNNFVSQSTGFAKVIKQHIDIIDKTGV